MSYVATLSDTTPHWVSRLPTDYTIPPNLSQLIRSEIGRQQATHRLRALADAGKHSQRGGGETLDHKDPVYLMRITLPCSTPRRIKLSLRQHAEAYLHGPAVAEGPALLVTIALSQKVPLHVGDEGAVKDPRDTVEPPFCVRSR